MRCFKKGEVPIVDGTIVALHSCGSLLDRAIETMLDQKLRQGIFVSCCYHRIQNFTLDSKITKMCK